MSRTASAVAPVTLTLIVVNVVMFILQQFSSDVINWLAFNPVFGYLQPWRLVTAAFVHANFTHLLFNMLMLYLVGSSVERALGWWRYLAVYLLSAVGGSMLIIGWLLVQPQSAATWTVGASGALYGLLAAILVLQRRAGMSTTSILVLLAVNLIYSFTMSNVSWQAHVGGFLMGLLATGIFVWAADAFRSRGQKTLTGMSLVALVALVVLSVAGTWGLYALVS
ncbi:rhomboid family intramembrane serine protease [Actinomycetaceae bacterium MB13-C1-2]|nr:rhomboid family intramembrane serine protease [Actinomycetaceae bacterium MB13-C1-2]